MVPIEPQVASKCKPTVALIVEASRPDFQPMVKSEKFDVGAALNVLIARSGKQKLELAVHMGVSEQAVQKWLKDGKIARENIAEICRFLDCSADELLGLVPICDRTTQAGGQSQPLKLDPERIAELATVLAERWKDVPGGFDLRNEAHAAHFVLCYSLYVNMKERPVPKNMVAFSAALTSPQGATKDERGEDVPATGTVKRKVRESGKR